MSCYKVSSVFYGTILVEPWNLFRGWNHTDLNGATNILRRAFPNADLSSVDKVLCSNPTKIYPLDTVKKEIQVKRRETITQKAIAAKLAKDISKQ